MKHQRKSFDSDGVQFAWDSTSLTLASECLRKYQYSMILNLQPSGPPNVHLLFGGAYAKSLERFYKYVSLGATKADALRDVVKQALIDTYEYQGFSEGEQPDNAVWSAYHGGYVLPKAPYPFLDNAKTRQTLIRSIVWYVDQFADEDGDSITTHRLADGSAAVELSFAVEFTDDLFYTGHIDRVVRYGGDLYWMDQKTTKSGLGTYYFDSFRLGNQFKGYTWAGQIILKSPVKGGIIDAANIQVGATQFERQPITFNDAILKEWHEQAVYHIRQAQAATRSGFFPQNFTACNNYLGCPFRELCKRSPTVRDRFISGDFVERAEPWDPLEAR